MLFHLQNLCCVELYWGNDNDSQYMMIWKEKFLAYFKSLRKTTKKSFEVSSNPAEIRAGYEPNKHQHRCVRLYL